MERTLKLSVKNIPFILMASGKKKNEYRRPSKWMLSRLYNKDGSTKQYDFVEFTNGYCSKCPQCVCKYQGFTYASKNYTATYADPDFMVPVIKGDIVIELGEIIAVTR